MQYKNRFLTIRLTEEEYKKLETAAKKNFSSISDYVRTVVLYPSYNEEESESVNSDLLMIEINEKISALTKYLQIATQISQEHFGVLYRRTNEETDKDKRTELMKKSEVAIKRATELAVLKTAKFYTDPSVETDPFMDVRFIEEVEKIRRAKNDD